MVPRPRGTENWRFMLNGETISVHPHGRFKADNGVTLAAAAVQGLGIAALPDFLIQDAIAAGTLVTVLAAYPSPPAGIYLVRPPSDFQIRKVRVLGDILTECFGAPYVIKWLSPANIGGQFVWRAVWEGLFKKVQERRHARAEQSPGWVERPQSYFGTVDLPPIHQRAIGQIVAHQ